MAPAPCLCDGGSLSVRDWRQRQVGPKECALPHLAMYVDETAVLLDDSVGTRKFHPTAFHVFLGRGERFEDVLSDFRLQPTSAVGDGKNREPASDDAQLEPAVGIVNINHLGFNQQPASLGHGVARIQAEIHEHLLNLRWIGFDGLRRIVDYFQFSVFPDDFVEEASEKACVLTLVGREN